MLFTNMVGVDLGTDTLKLRDRSGEKFMEIRNMIAMRGSKVLAIGDEAYEMYEKNPVDVRVIRPMVNGVIAYSTDMELVLTDALKKFTTFSQKSAGICLAVAVDDLEKSGHRLWIVAEENGFLSFFNIETDIVEEDGAVGVDSLQAFHLQNLVSGFAFHLEKDSRIFS